MSVFGYTRVSSETQVRDGQGLQIQAKKIQAYCLSKDLELDEVFTDPASSGATPLEDREAGRTMLSLLSRGDHVVIPSLDRAWRSVIDAEGTMTRWRDKGITPHILNLGVDLSTPMGQLFFTILAAFAEFERKVIGERIRSGVRAKIAQDNGVWGPQLRYGWTRDEDGKIVADPEEQDMIQHILTLKETGLTQLKIARRLNRGSYPKPRGGDIWTRSSVRTILDKCHLPPPGSI